MSQCICSLLTLFLYLTCSVLLTSRTPFLSLYLRHTLWTVLRRMNNILEISLKLKPFFTSSMHPNFPNLISIIFFFSPYLSSLNDESSFLCFLFYSLIFISILFVNLMSYSEEISLSTCWKKFLSFCNLSNFSNNTWCSRFTDLVNIQYSIIMCKSYITMITNYLIFFIIIRLLNILSRKFWFN